MSSASVTVLCSNARRQVVKVQASTKILEMIEEVCKKQGLDPNRFDLVFQKKHLDVTLTYRLSGVPNHAQLELVELESGPRQIAPVSVCLQLEDGTRLAVKEFPPAQTTLYAVLQAYSDLANERVTKALNSDNSSPLKPVVSYLNDQVIGHFQLTNTSLLDMGIASGRFVLRLSERQIEADEMERLDGEFRAKLAKKSRLDEIYAKKQNEQVINKESEKRTIEVEPEKISVPQETPKQEPKKPKIEEEVYHRKPEIKPKIVDEPIPVNEFVNFKFPEETRGQNLIASENELEAIERESREACDRIPVIFSLEKRKEEEESASNVAASSSKPGEIDDEFFSVTIDDLRSRLSDLKRMQNDEAPLMTRQMRELEKDKRAMKYSKVVVRISFKNGTMLQGLFRPKEPMNQLYKFVRSCLVSEDNDFQLFISPPKTILSDMKKTLFDAGLCPAAIVYFKPSANSKSESPELKADLKRVSLDEANELVDVNVHQTMRQIDHEGLKWLEKEGSLVQNILKGSSMATGSRTMVVYDDDGSAAAARQQRKDDDPVRQKMAKFFGSKK